MIRFSIEVFLVKLIGYLLHNMFCLHAVADLRGGAPLGLNSFKIFIHYSANILPNNRLTHHRLELAPPLGNPGSASDIDLIRVRNNIHNGFPRIKNWKNLPMTFRTFDNKYYSISIIIFKLRNNYCYPIE